MPTKAIIIDSIIEKVTSVICEVVKVYGVSNGVGYDLDVTVVFETGEIWELDAHAGPKSWDCHGHLRSNQCVFDAYKGRNNSMKYAAGVVDYWVNGPGLEYYLERHTKDALVDMLMSLEA